MDGWNKIVNQAKKIAKEFQVAKFGIRNNSTGAFVCDINGDVKKFNSMDEAKTYINKHRLSSFYEIQFLGKAVGKG